MSERNAARLAWSLGGLGLLLSAGSLAILAITADYPRPESLGPWASAVIDLIGSFAVPVVGAIVAVHRPRNPIGWLLLGGSITSTLSVFLMEWAFQGLLVEPGSLPLADVASVLAQTTWIFMISVIPLVLLLFPDGTLLSRRWRPVVFAAALPSVLGFPILIVGGWPHRGVEILLYSNDLQTSSFLDVVIVASIGIALLTICAATVSLVLRYRRGDTTGRLQIKWLVVAAAVLFVDGIASNLVHIEGVWRDAISSASFYLIPVAIGVAVLRYRLYDIDVVINRTLVYGLLTAILGAGYLGLVALMQLLLQPLTPQSDLSIVVSTLAVAALFRPLRARLQSFIDRRFYRRKYDAAATLDGFSARLREQVDLESLRREVVAVVGTTMQPAHASVWLRPREETR